MESQRPNPSYKMRGGTGKISLEDYLHFIQSTNQSDLTVNYLNQIIEMHGFKKIHKLPKKVLIDAVSTIEPMDPTRSTLNDDSISSDAYISKEEAVADLADLNWQECCVTSIQTLAKNPKPINAGGGGGVVVVNNNARNCFDGVSSSICSSGIGGCGDHFAMKLVPKRKRSGAIPRSGGSLSLFGSSF